MAGIATRITIVTILVLCAAISIEGCGPNGQRRRKRSVADLDFDLANFFGNCQPLKNAARGVFESLQSAVDYAIRDSNWYESVSSNLCTGTRDVVECWIYALDSFLDLDSVFTVSAAQCICDWAESEDLDKTCFVPPAGISKRQAETRGHSRGQCPPKNNKPKPLRPQERAFSNCLEKDARRSMQHYRSLSRFEGNSVTILLRDHYTFCRTVPTNFPYEQRNLFPLLFIDDLCPRYGSAASWRRDVLDVYREATRKDSPLWSGIEKCDPRESDPCDPNPCKNYGKCVPNANNRGHGAGGIYTLSILRPVGAGAYTCRCRKGYTGRNCEKKTCKDVAEWCNRYPSCDTAFASQCKETCGRC